MGPFAVSLEPEKPGPRDALGEPVSLNVVIGCREDAAVLEHAMKLGRYSVGVFEEMEDVVQEHHVNSFIGQSRITAGGDGLDIGKPAFFGLSRHGSGRNRLDIERVYLPFFSNERRRGDLKPPGPHPKSSTVSPDLTPASASAWAGCNPGTGTRERPTSSERQSSSSVYP